MGFEFAVQLSLQSLIPGNPWRIRRFSRRPPPPCPHQTRHRRRSGSIRAKLTVLVLASVGIAVAVVTGVSAWRNGQRETALQVDRLSAEAAVLGSLTSEAAVARRPGAGVPGDPLDRR